VGVGWGAGRRGGAVWAQAGGVGAQVVGAVVVWWCGGGGRQVAAGWV